MIMKAQRTAGDELICLKEFRFGGRTFKVGQSFPWRRLSCSERRVQLMQNKRLLAPARSDVVARLLKLEPVEPDPRGQELPLAIEAENGEDLED